MGQLLSVLITYGGVLEAVSFYQKFVNGIPDGNTNFDFLVRKYEEMFTQSLAMLSSRSEDWKKGDLGYLHISGGGRSGPLRATIKYFGNHQDSASILFSTKISSFGQDSDDYDYQGTRTTPKANGKMPEISMNESHFQNNNNYDPEDTSSFWDNDDTENTEESSEKIQWHYKPLSSKENSSLPEIHFDSYERKSNELNDHTSYSEEFLRSLDGVKFRPLQRDDGTGRRRSFKKRHSSSSTSSRESKASREEELNMFTSLEESEFENQAVNSNHNSAPNLTASYHSKGRSRNRSRDGDSSSPALELSPDKQLETRSRSPSSERRHLRDLPKVRSFEELPDENAETSTKIDDATHSNVNGEKTDEENEDSGVNFWDL